MVILSLLACLVTGLAYAWLLYRNIGHLDKRLRYSLFALRAVVVAVVLALLFFPLVRSISYQLQKPVIVIAQDNSLSVHHFRPAGFDHQQYEKDMRQLAKDLADQYEVKVYHFGDNVKTGFNFNYTGKLTNVNQLITRFRDDLSGRNIGAVVLASDGLFNQGGNPIYELDKLRSPIYTIGLGDTIAQKDLIIVNVNHNSLVYLDNNFTIEVQVQALESKGEASILTVLDNGKKVFQQDVQISSEAFVKNIPVTLKASKLGMQRYTVQLSPLAGEVSAQNNSQQVFIEVIDVRQKILIAAAAPHPDIAALKQAISSNKYFEVKVVIGEDVNALNPADYGLVVLHQIPAQQNTSAVFMARLVNSNVPLWYIVGMQSNLATFNQVQNGVSLKSSTSGVQETFSDANPGFTSFKLDDAAAKAIAQFDPLLAPSGGSITVAANASVVLNQRIGKTQTGLPQLFFMSEGARKTGYLIGEGLWRWKLSEAQSEAETPVFNGLISNVVQYLSVKDDKRKFRVYSSKATFDENESILLNAMLYNDSYMPVNTPDVNARITNEEGRSYNYLFSRTPSAYELNAGPLPPGNYSYYATVTLGDKSYTAQGRFYVSPLIAEYQQSTANHQLLYSMSEQTNGKMYMPQQLSAVLKDIETNENIKTLSYEDRKYEELISYKWLFAMLITLLTLEWFFRKRNGEV